MLKTRNLSFSSKSLGLAFFLVLSLTFSQMSEAKIFVFGSYLTSKASLYRGVESIEGDGFTAGAGYKFGPFSVEGLYRKREYDQIKHTSSLSGNQVTTDLSQKMYGVGGRMTLFFFVDIKGGILYYDTDVQIKDGTTAISSSGQGPDYGYYAGIGGKIPFLGYLDLFADATLSYAKDYDKLFIDYEGGLRIYF